MMNCLSRLAAALWVGTACWPVAAHAHEPARCTIASIQMATLTSAPATDRPQVVEGRVEVLCSSSGALAQTLEFALTEVGEMGDATEVGDEPSPTDTARRPTSPASPMAMELFADSDGLQALAPRASVPTRFANRQLIPAAGQAQLSIPFFARVVANHLPQAGEYRFQRNIGLLYRASAVH